MWVWFFFILLNSDVACKKAHTGLLRWKVFLSVLIYNSNKAELSKDRRQKNKRERIIARILSCSSKTSALSAEHRLLTSPVLRMMMTKD